MANATERAAGPAPAALVPARAGRPSLLVVDDDRFARRALAAILTLHSFTVSEAGSVAEAMQKLADRPDWILLDLMLPDGSGCAVLKRVAEQGYKSRVCVISGAGPALKEDARKLGPEHVLNKPLDLAQLLSILAT